MTVPGKKPLTEVGEGQLRRISRVLAAGGAALALAGVAAGCAAAAGGVPAADAKVLIPSASSSPSPGTAAASPSPSAVRTTAAPAPKTATPKTAAPKPPAPRAAKAPRGVPCAAGVSACVSLSEQEAWFISNGKVVRGPVRVATGRAGYGTEVGTFRVYRKNRMWYSTIYDNAPMPYSVFFDGGEAFHEGSVYVRSHGCVHLGASTAAWVFGFLHLGDKVQVVR